MIADGVGGDRQLPLARREVDLVGTSAQPAWHRALRVERDGREQHNASRHQK